MSVFLVGDKHISALLNNFVNTFHENETQLGQILTDENVKVYNEAYEDDVGVMPFKLRDTEPLHPVEILKACECYEYQACESSGYRTSKANMIINVIRDQVIKRLAGYVDAKWRIED